METHGVGDTRELYLSKNPTKIQEHKLGSNLCYSPALHVTPSRLFTLAGCTISLTFCSRAHQKHHSREEAKENRRSISRMRKRTGAPKNTH